MKFILVAGVGGVRAGSRSHLRGWLRRSLFTKAAWTGPNLSCSDEETDDGTHVKRFQPFQVSGPSLDHSSHSLGLRHPFHPNTSTVLGTSKYTYMGMTLRLMLCVWIRATINANMRGNALVLGLTATPLSCPQSPFSISFRLLV
jgi:hypothetical protein